jgi:hypothetical protein
MLRFLQVSVLLILYLSFQAHGDTACCVPIRLEVTPKNLAGNRLALSIKLTNTGTESVRFSNGFGPWAGPGQIQLIAIKLPGSEPIPNQLRAMVDPVLGFSEIEPGKALQYDVPVDELYRELALELKRRKSDIVLFWTYQLETANSKRSERVGGWLMLPKPADQSSR